MNNMFGLVLVAGLGLAGTAVYMVRGQFEVQAVQLAQYQQAVQGATPTVEVYAVTRAIAYGEPITPEDVQLIRYAEPFLPEGAFRTEEELFPGGLDVLRVALRPMEINEPVLAVKVTEPGGDVGITQRLTEGMRAFAIGVNATSGVSGFLKPGDRVDVYWTGTVEEGGLAPRQVTQLIESGLKLIAIDQSTDDTSRAVEVASSVTVEVSPQQVAKLAQAQSTGELSLSLVGQMDDTIASAIEVDQKALLGLEDTPEPPPPVIVQAPEPVAAPKVCTVRTRKGGEVFDTPIDCPAG